MFQQLKLGSVRCSIFRAKSHARFDQPRADLEPNRAARDRLPSLLTSSFLMTVPVATYLPCILCPCNLTMLLTKLFHKIVKHKLKTGIKYYKAALQLR